MYFLLDWAWWVALVIAAVSFGASSRPGIVISAAVRTIGRAVFILVVTLIFIRTGWPGGLAVCLGGGLAGLILPALIGSAMDKSVPAVPQAITREGSQRPDPVRPPMGRFAVLRDMAQNGISRSKVRRLIYHGRLLAFEDPEDGKISLVRPQDMDAMGLDPMDPENQGPR